MPLSKQVIKQGAKSITFGISNAFLMQKVLPSPTRKEQITHPSKNTWIKIAIFTAISWRTKIPSFLLTAGTNLLDLSENHMEKTTLDNESGPTNLR